MTDGPGPDSSNGGHGAHLDDLHAEAHRTGGSAGGSSATTHEGARGIARRIDHLGRVVIPSEYRKVFGIENGDLLDMTIEGDAVVVRRLERSCVFCRSLDDLGMFKGKLLCHSCLDALRAH